MTATSLVAFTQNDEIHAQKITWESNERVMVQLCDKYGNNPVHALIPLQKDMPKYVVLEEQTYVMVCGWGNSDGVGSRHMFYKEAESVSEELTLFNSVKAESPYRGTASTLGSLLKKIFM